MPQFDIYFEACCRLGKLIRTSKAHWLLITVRKHPEIVGLEDEVIRTLVDPDVIRMSQDDGSVFLYYRAYRRYYLVVVCRHLNGEGFIITSYLTDRIKEGDAVWPR